VAFPNPNCGIFWTKAGFGGTYLREFAEKRSAKGLARSGRAILWGLVQIVVNAPLTASRKLSGQTNVIFECFD
jgi:hypothetical protein